MNNNIIVTITILILALTGNAYSQTTQELKKRAEEILIDGLTSRNETLRLDSISNIEKVKISNQNAEDKILDLFTSDPSDVVKARTIYSLVRLKGEAVIPALKQSLNYKGTQAYLVHLAAAGSLYKLGHKDAIKVISRYLDSGRLAESVEAASVAGDLHGEEIVSLLKQKLDTQSNLLRNAILESLVRLGENINETEIVHLLSSKQFSDQWTALSIIAISNDTRFIQQLRLKLNSENPLIRIRAAELLTILTPESFKSVVIEYIKSDVKSYSGISSEDVKVLALHDGLFEIGETSDLPLLKGFLKGDGRLSIMAAGVILRIIADGNSHATNQSSRQ